MTREEIRDALQSTQFALSAAFVQEVAQALLAHQTAGQPDADEATARRSRTS